MSELSNIFVSENTHGNSINDRLPKTPPIFCFKIPSLTGETLTPLYHHNRDGERKPKRESENSTSLNMSSTGKLVMTSNFANAMPWCMDTMLPTTVISGSAEGPNETGQKSLSFQSLVPGFVFPCSSVTELYRNI